MPRTVNATLAAALAANNYKAANVYIKVYGDSQPDVYGSGVPANVISYQLSAQDLTVTVPATDDFSPTYIGLRRGLTLSGVTYTIDTSVFYVTHSTPNEDSSRHTYHARLVDPSHRVFFYSEDAYATIANTIATEATVDGGLPTLKDDTEDYWDNRYEHDTGREIKLLASQAARILLAKFFISFTDVEDGEIQFFAAHNYNQQTVEYTINTNQFIILHTPNPLYIGLVWRDETNTWHSPNVAVEGHLPFQNIGYKHTTDPSPTITSLQASNKKLHDPNLKAIRVPMNLSYLTGDYVTITGTLYTGQTKSWTGYLNVVESFEPDKSRPWGLWLSNLPLHLTTEGGNAPSNTTTQSSNPPAYSQAHTISDSLVDSSLFSTILNPEQNTLREVLYGLDVHEHASIPTTEQIQDIVGAMLSGNTETGIAATYEDSDGTIDLIAEVTQAELDTVSAAIPTTEQIQDIVGAMLSGNTEHNIEVEYQDSDGTIDFNTIFLFPLATYIDLNPITASGKYPYGGTVEASITFVKWTVSFFTATSHTSSAYYTLELKLRQSTPGADVTLATIDTKTIIGGQQTTLSTTTFSQGVTGTGYLYVQCTKTSTPTDIYVLAPALRCKLT